MPEKTKLEEEYDSLKTGLRDIRDEIDSRAPPWIVPIATKLIKDQRTAWFFAGLGTEALGITIYFQFVGVSYPILDFIVSFLIFFALLYFGPRMDDDDDTESDDEDA